LKSILSRLTNCGGAPRRHVARAEIFRVSVGHETLAREDANTDRSLNVATPTFSLDVPEMRATAVRAAIRRGNLRLVATTSSMISRPCERMIIRQHDVYQQRADARSTSG